MDLKLPPLGEGADSGTVVNLFVKEGDEITKDQPILELENEKAVATIPSSGAGKVSQVFVKPGDKVSVGQRLLVLDESGARKATPEKTEPGPKTQAAAPEKKTVDARDEEEKPQEKVEPEAQQPAH